MELNNKRNGEIDRFSGVWDSPLRADIIAVSGREPVIQYLVIERVELGLDSLLVVVKLYGLRQYILRIAATGETKNCVGNQNGKAISHQSIAYGAQSWILS